MSCLPFAPCGIAGNAQSCSTANASQFRLHSAMRFLSSIRIVRVALALAVALWMAGAGCMLGCENMATAAIASDHHATAEAAVIVASGEACASMHSHDCCAKGASHSSTSSKSQTNANHSAASARTHHAIASESIAPSTVMMDCPLAVNAMAALPKSRANQSSTALLSAGARPVVSNSVEQTTPFSRPLRLPNRGHTYLRCCTFLI